MATYGVYPSGIVRATVDTDDGERVAYIPPDPANKDYAAYLAWVEEGNTAETLADPAALDESEQQSTERNER